MEHAIAERRRIASHAREEDYTPVARVLLRKLGYAILPVEELAVPPAPDLRIVDARRLAEIPPDAPEPILLLGGRRDRGIDDPRVVGVVARPAGPHELYRLLQATLEKHPRSVPRVSASLEAIARSDETSWPLRVLSLSENGCLAAGDPLPPLDAHLRLELSLPGQQRIEVPAHAAYETGARLGLVFQGMHLSTRRLLQAAVTALLVQA